LDLEIKDAELSNKCIYFGWDTTAEEVVLQFSMEDDKVIQEVPLTTDHFQPLFDAEWLKGIDRDKKLTATVIPKNESVRSRRETGGSSVTFTINGMIDELKEDPNFKFLVKLTEPCTIIGTEPEPANHGTPIAISILATFVVTAAAVAFLTTVLVLVLSTYYSKKKKQKKEELNAYNCTSSPDSELKTKL
jgi:hypothetical protein